eukprot:3273356-Pyramimonas_sp.AAC.1
MHLVAVVACWLRTCCFQTHGRPVPPTGPGPLHKLAVHDRVLLGSLALGSTVASASTCVIS